MDTVVYCARLLGLGFAAYENLAYLVSTRTCGARSRRLRSVLTHAVHGALGIIAGAYLADRGAPAARSAPTAGHRDWARITNWAMVLVALVLLGMRRSRRPAARAAVSPRPQLDHTLLLGTAGVLIGFSSICSCGIRLVRRLGRHHAPRADVGARAAEPVATDVGAAADRRRHRLCRGRLPAHLAASLVRQSRAQCVLHPDPDRLHLDPDRTGAVGRDHRRSTSSAATGCGPPSEGFPSAPGQG